MFIRIFGGLNNQIKTEKWQRSGYIVKCLNVSAHVVFNISCCNVIGAILSDSNKNYIVKSCFLLLQSKMANYLLKIIPSLLFFFLRPVVSLKFLVDLLSKSHVSETRFNIIFRQHNAMLNCTQQIIMGNLQRDILPIHPWNPESKWLASPTDISLRYFVC